MSARARTRSATRGRLQNVIAAEEDQEITPALQPVRESEPDEMLYEDSEDEDMSYRSSGTSNRADWYAKNSKIELEAPTLEIMSTEKYKIFLPAWRKYNKDKRGLQRMAQLVADKPKCAICRILKIAVQDFTKLSDEQCEAILNKYFRISDINFRTALSTTQMTSGSNDLCKLEKIQIYVGEFLN